MLVRGFFVVATLRFGYNYISMPTFSERNGFSNEYSGSLIRNSAPEYLRDYVRGLIKCFCPNDLLSIHEYLADKLLLSPIKIRSNLNLSHSDEVDISNVDYGRWGQLAWYDVYDVIEYVSDIIRSDDRERQEERECTDCACERCSDCKYAFFEDKINTYFIGKGIGWKLVDGKIEIRGEESFEQTTKQAMDLAAEIGKTTSAAEMKEAIVDLSRKPNPDLTGAMHHSMAALECLARDITGQRKLTLGGWLKANKGQFPAPINDVVEQLWGYASNNGRHIVEGTMLTYEEVELVVSLSAALSTYLMRKNGSGMA
jgi:hypothetical protein